MAAPACPADVEYPSSCFDDLRGPELPAVLVVDGGLGGGDRGRVPSFTTPIPA